MVRRALEAQPLNGHGANQHSDSGLRDCELQRKTGTGDADYLTARIARDAPAILEDMKAGKYRSVRAAAIDAGIIDPERVKRYNLPANDPTAAGRYLAQRVDREWFMQLVDAFYKAAEE